jgi:hypothetical protein
MHRGKERSIEEKKGKAEEETKGVGDVGPGIAERYFVLWFAHRFEAFIP